MSDSTSERHDDASSHLDPGSEDVKHGREVARAQARWVRRAAAAIGAAFLLVGIAGFVPGLTTDLHDIAFAGHDSGAELLGIFQVSVLHNLVHLAFGVAGLALARRASGATAYLVGGGVIYLVVWFYGVAVGAGGSANVLPANSADNWLHLVLGLGMVLLGLMGRRAAIAPGQPVAR